MRTLAACALLILLLTACGGETEDSALTPWQHASLTGLRGASGMTLLEGDLVFVCGDDNRDIYTVARDDLRSGAEVRVRTLAVETKPDATLMGSEAFAYQDYKLEHLWKVPVDFQGVAAQKPGILYVGERHRRLVFWGRLTRSADGRLSHVKFAHVAVVPGADRSGVATGDWRDKGPGLRGLVAVKPSAKMEDLWLVDAGAPGKPIQVRRFDRYGGNRQGLRARHRLEGSPDVRAVSWDRDRLVVLLGRGRGRFVTLKPPPPGTLESVPEVTGVPGPAIDGVEGWTGMAHAKDGTIYLVSGGSPAIVAWRRP